ncbi:MAG: TlyA family RNA methyltransferase [Alphaproteobacteria bacterium]|nr:TlyA family RNA methyltransferase [Alphaproteobacteria bacterium]
MRLDIELVNRNLYPTRAKAVTAIKFGLVFVNSIRAEKSSQIIKEFDEVKVNYLPFASGRGSLKLAHALDHFKVNPAGLTCLDVGASTGGFTEVLLNRGAAKVFAVDVGTDQMIMGLKSDSRVVSLENTDIRTLPPIAPIDLAVIDVSFISLLDVAPAIAKWKPRQIIALIKPQFEVPRAVAAKHKGIIKSEKYHAEGIEKVLHGFASLGFKNCGVVQSPITGGSGNVEYLTLFSNLYSNT